MNVRLLQEYVDEPLAEIGVSSRGHDRVKAKLDRTDPVNKAWVRAHGLTDTVEFASHLASLARRQGRCVTLNGTRRYLMVTT